MTILQNFVKLECLEVAFLKINVFEFWSVIQRPVKLCQKKFWFRASSLSLRYGKSFLVIRSIVSCQKSCHFLKVRRICLIVSGGLVTTPLIFQEPLSLWPWNFHQVSSGGCDILCWMNYHLNVSWYSCWIYFVSVWMFNRYQWCWTRLLFGTEYDIVHLRIPWSISSGLQTVTPRLLSRPII